MTMKQGIRRGLCCLASALMATACTGDSGAGELQASEPGAAAVPGRMLVAYFSWSGTTERVAKTIAEQTGADLFRIETAEPYPTDYVPCTEMAKAERDNNIHPALKGKVENMDAYDVIFVGCPVWWHTAPMALHTFLLDSGYNLKGKTVVPFCTYAETYRNETLAKIVELTPDSKHLKGLGLTSHKAGRITDWLRSINIIK